MLFDIRNITFDELNSPLLQQKNVQLSVARLDKIHPVVSGNKLFKLHYFLEECASGDYTSIRTFGGAYSNHLVATAFACKKLQVPCTGIVRGEKPANLSPTLLQCMEYNMQLEFVSREEYGNISNEQLTDGNILNIPEGGFHPLGAKGASLIMDHIKAKQPTHVCLTVGTATTLAGILQKAGNDQQVIAIPVLKGMDDITKRLYTLNGKADYEQLQIWSDYHFGGYAKKTAALLDCMNELYREYHLPTDFVYTAKMMYAVLEAVQQDHFPPGSHIMCLHTGGLQGNRSLPAGSIIF